MNKYTAIDLFSGCGGLSFGLEKAGFDVRVAVEIDPSAVMTYQKNHPGTRVIQSDIKKISGQDLIQAARIGDACLDLLAGCPPCQGFSRITTRNRPDHNDPRNKLVLDFLRITKELRPRLVLLENVPGLSRTKLFSKLLSALEKAGYHTDWAVLDASDFNVPQRRKRLIMMASRVGDLKVPKGSGAKRTVRDCIGRLAKPRKAHDVLQKMHLKNSSRIKKMISRVPRNGGSRAAWGDEAQLACHKRTPGFRDVYGRMRWDDVAPTLTSGCFNPSKGRFLHPSQNRPITLREAALLQSFPRRYRFPPKLGLTIISRLIGDALPPRFGEAQGRYLFNFLISRQHFGGW